MDSCENTVAVSKLSVNCQNLYIKLACTSKSKDTLFNINIYEGNNCWSGTFSSEFASQVEESEDKYNNNVKRALSGNCDDFIFDFCHEPGASIAKLSWKKIFDDSTVMPYGCVELQLDGTETKDSLIDFLLDENKELKVLVDIYDKKNVALNEKVDKCKSELEEFVNEKIALEANLYGKFVQILNEKKERIRLLEETIQNFE